MPESYKPAIVGTCRRGHPRTPENTKILVATGAKICIVCRRIRDAERREEYKKPTKFRHYSK